MPLAWPYRFGAESMSLTLCDWRSRQAELAIRALAMLGNRRRVKASVLAEGLGTTVSFVPQVLGPLVRQLGAPDPA